MMLCHGLTKVSISHVGRSSGNQRYCFSIQKETIFLILILALCPNFLFLRKCALLFYHRFSMRITTLLTYVTGIWFSGHYFHEML